MTISYPQLTSDCSRCAALCCMAFAFDRSDKFAIDKNAGEPCRYLNETHQCSIHDRLTQAGFAGCVRYDCLGAGQRVTQEVFDGRSWQQDPSLKVPMMEAFRGMRRLHEALGMLKALDGYILSSEAAERRATLLSALMPEQPWTQERLLAAETGSLFTSIDGFFAELRRSPPRKA